MRNRQSAAVSSGMDGRPLIVAMLSHLSGVLSFPFSDTQLPLWRSIITLQVSKFSFDY